MEKERKSLGTQGSETGSNQGGFAYISIPENEDRDAFILQCYRTQTVMLRDEFGSTWDNIFISKGAIQLIKFPDLSSERGSAVFWQKVPKHNIPVVTEIFESKSSFPLIQEEDQFRFMKVKKNGNLVDFNARAQSAEMLLAVSSTENDKGILRANITNPNKTAKLDVYVKGESKVFADKQIRFGTNEKIDLEVFDEDMKLLSHLSYSKDDGWVLSSKSSGSGSILHIDDSKINLGSLDANEKAVLGDTLKQKLEDLINQISAITVPTPLGPSGIPINKAAFDQIKIGLGDILSQKIRLD